MNCLKSFLMVTALLIPGAARAQEEDAADAKLYQAFYLESALRQMDEAAATYGAAAELAQRDGRVDLLVKALLGQGRCQRALGDLAGSRALLERALALDPACAEARAALATATAPAGIDPALSAEVQALVQRLAGPDSNQAEGDLLWLGDFAVPFLAEALRSRNVRLVRKAAERLAFDPGPSAIQAFLAAFTDPEVLFLHIVADKLDSIGFTEPNRVELWDRALTHPDERVRTAAYGSFARRLRKAYTMTPEELTVWRRAVANPTPAVRAAAIRALELGLRSPPEMEEAVRESLRELARSPERSDRWAVLDACRKQSARAGALAEVLFGALSDPEPTVRDYAALVIAEHAKSGVFPSKWLDAAMPALLASEGMRSMAEFLALDPAPWPPATQEAVFELLTDAVTQGTMERLSGGFFEHLVDPKAEVALDAERLSALFLRVCAAPAPYGTSARGAGGYAATDDGAEILERVLRRVAKLLPTGEERAAWALDTFRKTNAEGGQLRLLAFGSNAKTGEQCEELLFTAAAAEHELARQAGYGRLEAFADIGDRLASLPHLLADICSTNPETVRQLFKLIERYPGPRFTEAARTYLNRCPDHLRHRALRFLAECAGENALPEVREALESRNSDEFSEAVEQLVHILGSGAVPDLVALAKRRGSAAAPLGAFEQSGIGEILGLSPEVLAAYVESVPPEICRADFIQRVKGTLPAPQLEKVVLAGLASPDANTVYQACQAAGDGRVTAALPVLAQLLEYPNGAVSAAAREAIGAITVARERALEQSLLGPGGKAAALEQALALVNSDDPLKRQGGAFALAALGDAAAVPALIKLLDDENEDVRQAALKALEKLGGKAEETGS